MTRKLFNNRDAVLLFFNRSFLTFFLFVVDFGNFLGGFGPLVKTSARYIFKGDESN